MLLAVDTSTRSIGVALYDGVRVLNEMSWISKNHHTIELAPAVEGALVHVGAQAAHVDTIRVPLNRSPSGVRPVSRPLRIAGRSADAGRYAEDPPDPAGRSSEYPRR